ncbi:MAG TPA: hydrogen gas-evolving membrane-bound hydrogenase subunit E [Candidatus Binatia bacterium]|nr:hydrogen gas-evolving membrane-bound hydrogenase subunit E [Candidatus Binatia bacterium]
MAAALLPGGAALGARGLAWANGIVVALTLALAIALGGPALVGDAAVVSLPWVPGLGLGLSLRLDGLALLFALLILGIGLLVVVYARFYLAADEALPRFYASLLLFMAAMLGIVTSDNLLLLVVFWELTSVASFLLIGFWDRDAAARAGAWQALMVTGMGGLALLAGVLVLGAAAGTFELSALRAHADQVRSLPAAHLALALILLGAFTKSAQVPFHFWLPSAMAAPTPVSAYLHSATMVKAGIFLLARLSPIFADTLLWHTAVIGVGATTMLVGGWAALRHTDLKRLLAYSTVSQLGLITMLYGLGTEAASVAATFHVLNHATFKAALFMIAGIVDHEAGTRDLARLGGLVHTMPRTTVLACLAAAAMAGIPPLNGFVSKEMFYESALDGPLWLPILSVVGSTLTAAYTLRFVMGAFFGRPADPSVHAHEAPAGLRLPVEVLVLVCLAVGIAPSLVAEPLVTAAASAVVGAPVHPHLALWHGLTPALGLSAVGLLAGAALWAARRGTARTALPPRFGRTAGEMYDVVVRGLLHGAHVVTDGLQNGSLRRYVVVVLGCTVTLIALGIGGDADVVRLPMTTAPIAAWLLTLVTPIAAVATAVLYRRRWPSVLALGAVGLFVALYFAWLSAPDLVLTQLLVESVTTILLVLVLFFLPKETHTREPRRRLAFDATVAAIVGSGVTAVAYGVMRRPFESISRYHLAHSLPDGGGANVVNVILVDFRGYDTLGEITVLAIAAIGIVALLQAGRRTA